MYPLELVVTPTCNYCGWALLEGELHSYCESELDSHSHEDAEDHDEDDVDDYVSFNAVRSRINAHFGSNSELAREAAELYPGDFM